MAHRNSDEISLTFGQVVLQTSYVSLLEMLLHSFLENIFIFHVDCHH